MSHWKLILAYDGTPFHGWQIQPGQPTVQGLLSDAIYRTVGERVLPQGSGRTDAGVHALAQVASFTLQAPIPAENFHNALNRCLPPSVRVLSVDAVPPDFHARHSAIGKTYEYRIFPLKPLPDRVPDDPVAGSEANTKLLPGGSLRSAGSAICPPILAPFVWPCPWPLDLAALNRAAVQVIGTHDFTSFAASDPDLTARTQQAMSAFAGSPGLRPSGSLHEQGEGAFVAGICAPAEPPASNIRTISQSHWSADAELLIYRVTGNGFLHHMVRNLVGTFVQCGAHRLSPESIPDLLAARDRSAAGPTAPATGLFLVSVEYDSADNQHPTTGNSL
jgi:tRNA pseudouridine38-40 synthase